MLSKEVVLIIYTTKYRLGGHQFPVVAETFADEKCERNSNCEVITRAVESKRDVLKVLDEICAKDKQIKEFSNLKSQISNLKLSTVRFCRFATTHSMSSRR